MADWDPVLNVSELDGDIGFRIAKILTDETVGFVVKRAGDINRDGIGDLLVASYDALGETGALYFVLGSAAGFPAQVELDIYDPPSPPPPGREAPGAEVAADEPAVQGFRLDGIDPYDITAFSAVAAGDVNGDGFDDVIIGAPGADPDGDRDAPGPTPAAGVTYVVFGSATPPPTGFSLANLDGFNGFRIDGVAPNDYSGWSVDGVGDFNGDGFDDMLIGARVANQDGMGGYTGAAYVVFGSGDPFAASMDLAGLDGANGFRIHGLDDRDRMGYSVSGAGDVNGDGFADIIVGARSADPDGLGGAGETYVVFGSDTPFQASFDLGALNGANGFRIDGANTADASGVSVSDAGDVNGDGFADLIVGADGVDLDGPDGYAFHGAAYVVFGSGVPFAADLDLADLDGSDGFRLRGGGNSAGAGAQTGYSVASAGDVNGDGFDDLIVGALRARPGPAQPPFGAAFIVFGSAAPFAADFDLTTLDGTNGFRINGATSLDYLGSTVASADDVNGDGFDDIAVGAFGTDEAYVIFGRAPTTAVVRTGSAAGQTIRGGAFDDRLFGLGGNDSLDGGAGNDRLSGGAGVDTASYAFAAAGVRVNLAVTAAQNTLGAGVDTLISIENADGSAFSDVLRGHAGVNRLGGGAGNDSLFGLDGRDILIGGAGDDLLNGGTGYDRMEGGLGDDLFLVHDSGDVAVEGAGGGRDQVNAYVNHRLGAHVEVLRLIGTVRSGTGNAIDNGIFGSNGDNLLSGLGGNDILRGLSGVDDLRGGDGDDIGYGGLGDDVLFGENGADRLNGESGADILVGGDGADRLFGDTGRDELRGGTGDDLLAGGAQRDTLTGNAGADLFAFAGGDTGATRFAADIITDFSRAGGDRIHLRQLDANVNAGGNQDLTFVGTAAFSGVAGELRYDVFEGNTYIQGDTNGDRTVDFFIRVDGVVALVASDFIL